MSRLSPSLIALWLLLASGNAALARGRVHASRRDEARAHFQLADAHFNLGAFDQARTEFDAAYRLDPQPLLLFNAGLAARNAGDARSALERFRRFLHVAPRAPERRETLRYIAELRRQAAIASARPAVSETTAPGAEAESASDATAAPDTSEAAAPPPARLTSQPTARARAEATKDEEPAPESDRPVPLYKRWWLWTAVGAVVVTGVALGVGLGLGLESSPSWKPSLPDVSVKMTGAALTLRF